jgi:hypothetical protein
MSKKTLAEVSCRGMKVLKRHYKNVKPSCDGWGKTDVYTTSSLAPHSFQVSTTLTSHLILTTRVFAHPFLQHTSPFSFFCANTALRLASPPSNPIQVPVPKCRSTASFGSPLGTELTTVLHNGHWGAIRSCIDLGSGEVHA